MKDTKVSIQQDKLNYCSDILRALAHPTRMKILEYLDQHTGTQVNSIYRDLGLEQSITSQHLRIMREAGVVHGRKEGKFMFYTIDYPLIDRAVQAVNRFVAASAQA